MAMNPPASSSPTEARVSVRRVTLHPRPPAPHWVAHLMRGGHRTTPVLRHQRCRLGVIEAGEFVLLELVALRAAAMHPLDFQRTVVDLYMAAADGLRSRGSFVPVRFWNYVPRIHERSGDGLDRYMVFNAGRFAALTAWFGSEFQDQLTAASAVGHGGEDLVVHVLASPRPGIRIENPRQLPAPHYSQAYGPIPPCFARATVLRSHTPNTPHPLLISGTASVVGEHSVHADNLRAQLDETCLNLQTLLQSGGASGSRPGLMHELRAYIVRPDDEPPVISQLTRAFPSAHVIEVAHADICRRDLLVEVEGVARLPV